MKTVRKFFLFCFLFCVILIAKSQTFDLKDSREAYKISELGLHSFDLYYTNIFNIYGKTYRNPNVEKETNGLVQYSEWLRSSGVLKEEWREYPVRFYGFQFEEGMNKRNLVGTNPELSMDILENQKSYFENKLGFNQVQDYISLTTLEKTSVRRDFFGPEVYSEASKLFSKSTFDNIIQEQTHFNGMQVVSFFFKQNTHFHETFHVSTYVYLNKVLLFTSILNIDLCNRFYEYDYDCMDIFDLADFHDEKYLKPMVNTLFENIEKN